MTLPRFLAPTSALAGDRVALTGEEARHAAVVRRIRPGEHVDVTDGCGLVVSVVVRSVDRDAVAGDVVARVLEPAPAPRFVVVQALAKGGRDEDAVEAMTEAGVDEVVPWQAARSVARWKERSAERWAATARGAAKQARRAWVPRIAPAAGTEEIGARLASAALGVVLHETAQVALAWLPLPADGDVVVVVGPEGGLTDGEVAVFEAAGAVTCRLGPSVLRASTAGVAALSVLSAAARWR